MARGLAKIRVEILFQATGPSDDSGAGSEDGRLEPGVGSSEAARHRLFKGIFKALKKGVSEARALGVEPPHHPADALHLLGLRELQHPRVTVSQAVSCAGIEDALRCVRKWRAALSFSGRQEPWEVRGGGL